MERPDPKNFTPQSRARQGFDMPERLRFLGIDDELRQSLRDNSEEVLKAMPAVMDKFYAHISKYPDLSNLFGNSQTRMDGAKQLQTAHWRKIMSGDFDDDYGERVRRIGVIHHKIGLEPRWYIGGNAEVLSHLIGTLSKPSFFGRKKREKMIEAVIRAAMLDMEMSISTYYEEAKGEIDSMVTQISANVTGLVGEIAGSIQSAADEFGAIASASTELSSSAAEIRKQVGSSSSMSTEVSRVTADAVGQVTRLSEVSAQIAETMTQIRSIANQTNLLALNAAIEAARAGAAGRGFAVVATEVKTLANKVNEATVSIESKIDQVRMETETAVENISMIAERMGAMDNTLGSMNHSVAEQTVATEDIMRRVSRADDNVNSLTAKAEELRNRVSALVHKYKK